MSNFATDGRWSNTDWKPDLLIHEPTPNFLSSSAGLARMLEIFVNTPGAFSEMRSCLPERVSNSSEHPVKYAMILLAGFWLGYDCLDDLEKMQSDPIILSLFGGKIPCAKSFGNFLRDFTKDNLIKFRSLLATQALSYRRMLKREKGIEFNVDSTDHVHHGDLIEGLELNYKGHWCLDSLEVFDELGFCYDFDLRSGATFSSVGSVAMMNGIMDRRPLLPMTKTDFIRGDSAYCNEEFLRMCLLRRLKGTITAHGNIRYMEEVTGIGSWQPWTFTEKEIKRSILLQRPLPKVDLGYYMYAPAWADGKLKFPVVVKRTFKTYEQISRKKRAELIKEGKDPKQGLFEYYAVLSLMGLHPRTLQELMEFHQKRGNMENMIKEGKLSYDLRHFPCRKMTANHAYALFGMMAHNFFRLIATLDDPDQPKFAKALRHKFIHFPGRTVRGQNKTFLKIPKTKYEEVEVLIKRWLETFKPAREFSTA
jgi:hypothetical protein